MTELNFKGKEFVYNHHLSVPFRPLVPHADKGIGEVNLDGNLIIQGDNLHALKALLPRYAGKVDCIFIDPPYNTGNEGWAYNDNVNAPMIKEWLAANPIGIEDGLRHDKWCAMMWPRLKLLHEMLSEIGIIAVTIDRNELDHLLLIMNEIFGQDNRLAIAVWQSDPSGGKQKTALRTGHEYIVFYGGGDPKLAKEAKEDATLDLTDERGPYAKGRELNKWGANSRRADRQSMFFPLISPDGGEVYPIRNDGAEGCWRFGAESALIKDAILDYRSVHWEIRPFDPGIVIDGKTERWVPYEKIRDVEKLFGWSTWIAGLTTNADGSNLLKAIFKGKAFDTPKPLKLLNYIVSIVQNDAALFLDSFAGSGTTAHAILEANKRDGGNRKFILVEMEHYADKLTAERVRRVIKGYDFTGTQKTELLREGLNYRALQNSADLVQKVHAIENLHGQEYDRITKQVKDGELVVTGEKTVAERTEALGGLFTYCTLGEPVELDAILTGKRLPSYDALGSVLYHMATNRTLESAAIRQSDFHLGEHGDRHVWLIYKPDLEWLKGPEAALTLSFARKIATDNPDKDHLVFAASRFVSEKLLSEEGLRVEFVPLPFALYRIEQS